MQAQSNAVERRDLEHAVRRALANGELQQLQDYPIEDSLVFRINNEDKMGVGATCYTLEQLDDYDCRIALHLCPKVKDAAKLLGIHASTVSRKRRRLGR
jgi:hypothetical protein